MKNTQAYFGVAAKAQEETIEELAKVGAGLEQWRDVAEKGYAEGGIYGTIDATNKIFGQAAWLAKKSYAYGDIFDVIKNTRQVLDPPVVHINIQGSADQKTIDEAVRKFKALLQNVKIEATSSGANVMTSRLRVP